MGSSSSILLQNDEIDSISAETGFTKNQIKRLYTRFTSLDKHSSGYLSKSDFLNIPEVNVNPLCDRLIQVLLEDHSTDG
jgi:calcineurin B homologous protein 1